MPGPFRTVLFLYPGLIFPRIIPGGFAVFSDSGRQGQALPRMDPRDLFSWCRCHPVWSRNRSVSEPWYLASSRNLPAGIAVRGWDEPTVYYPGTDDCPA